MKILIACEESQEVCKAFRELGFEAYSCDIQDRSWRCPSGQLHPGHLRALEGRRRLRCRTHRMAPHCSLARIGHHRRQVHI